MVTAPAAPSKIITIDGVPFRIANIWHQGNPWCVTSIRGIYRCASLEDVREKITAHVENNRAAAIRQAEYYGREAPAYKPFTVDLSDLPDLRSTRAARRNTDEYTRGQGYLVAVQERRKEESRRRLFADTDDKAWQQRLIRSQVMDILRQPDVPLLPAPRKRGKFPSPLGGEGLGEGIIYLPPPEWADIKIVRCDASDLEVGDVFSYFAPFASQKTRVEIVAISPLERSLRTARLRNVETGTESTYAFSSGIRLYDVVDGPKFARVRAGTAPLYRTPTSYVWRPATSAMF